MSESNQEVRLHALDYWQVIRNRYGIVLLAFFLVFMTATVITYMMPKEYRGRVTLQIKKETKDIELERPQRRIHEPYQTFMQTQFAIMESKENLGRVVSELNLKSRWGLPTENDAYLRLSRKLRTREIKGTDVVEIEVFDPNPRLAADLANQVAESYRDRRSELNRESAMRTQQDLEFQAATQERLKEVARQEMMRLAEENLITDTPGGRFSFGAGDYPVDGQGEIVRNAGRRVYDRRAEIASIRTTIDALTGLDPHAMIPSAVELGINNPTLTNRYPEYQSAMLMRGELRNSGLGARHPKVLTNEGTVAALEEMLIEAVESSKRTLKTKMKLKEDELANEIALKEGAEGTLRDNRRDAVGYITARDEYRLHRDLLTELNQKIALAQADGSFSEHPIVIHGRAEIPHSPAKPNVNLQLAIGAILGMIFGIGLAFFLEYLDTSVKTLEDVERYLGVPVLAVIPQEVGVLHQQNGMSPDAEAYRILRTNIEFNRKSAEANSITVVSGGAGEGKSTTLVNLAYICAQGGYNTLMIDGDLRRPKLHTFFDINNSVGLTNYLTTDLDLEDVILQTPIDNLYFMPSGILPADAAGILNSRRMSELIDEVKGRFDLVLVDSPPILGVSDASVLASEVDLTMIVIQHRKLPRGMLVRVKQAVENVGGNLLGVVLNNVDVRSDSQYQYYTSYYTYYTPEAGRRPARTPEPKSDPSRPAEFVEVDGAEY